MAVELKAGLISVEGHAVTFPGGHEGLLRPKDPGRRDSSC